jgi:hypothetical protein
MHSYFRRDNEMYSLNGICNRSRHLCEAEVLATSRHGCVESLLEGFVIFVLGKIEFCETVSMCMKGSLVNHLRLKQVWLDGKRSLLP